MSEACPKCPGCGAEEYVRTDVGKQYECVEYECGSRWWPNAPNRPPLHRNECFTRQLAQRDERNAALEAEIVELRRAINGVAPTDPWRFEDLDLCVALNNHADLVAVAPVVRAAIAAHDVAEQCREINPSNYDHEDVCDVNNALIEVTLLLRAGCAIPADVRERLMALERMGVKNEG